MKSLFPTPSWSEIFNPLKIKISPVNAIGEAAMRIGQSAASSVEKRLGGQSTAAGGLMHDTIEVESIIYSFIFVKIMVNLNLKKSWNFFLVKLMSCFGIFQLKN